MAVAKVKRSDLQSYLKVTAGSSEKFLIEGLGADSITYNFDVSTEDSHPVTDVFGSSDSTGMNFSYDVDTSVVGIEGSKGYYVDNFIDSLSDGKIGAEAETECLLVYKYKKVGDTFRAKKYSCSAYQASIGGDGGASLSRSYHVAGKGDPVLGTVVLTAEDNGDISAVFTADSTPVVPDDTE